jgi:hypothetical protein
MSGVFVRTVPPKHSHSVFLVSEAIIINTQQGVGHMGTEPTRYAIGDFGQLYKFTGKDVPAGTVPLVEEDGISLTAKGKAYAARHSEILPNVEIIRVQFDQYSSNNIGFAMEAHDKTLTKIPEMLEPQKSFQKSSDMIGWRKTRPIRMAKKPKNHRLPLPQKPQLPRKKRLPQPNIS